MPEMSQDARVRMSTLLPPLVRSCCTAMEEDFFFPAMSDCGSMYVLAFSEQIDNHFFTKVGSEMDQSILGVLIKVKRYTGNSSTNQADGKLNRVIITNAVNPLYYESGFQSSAGLTSCYNHN